VSPAPPGGHRGSSYEVKDHSIIEYKCSGSRSVPQPPSSTTTSNTPDRKTTDRVPLAHGHLAGPRAVGGALLFIAIVVVSVVGFVLVRKTSEDSQAAEAETVAQFAISRVGGALDALREELSATQMSIEVTLSEFTELPGSRVRFPDLRDPSSARRPV